MAGLLSQQQQQPGAGGAPMPPAGGGGAPMPGDPNAMAGPAGGEDDSNVSPEEQAQYDQWVTNGMQLMYSEQVMPQILETVAGGGDPIQGLANAVAMITIRLEDSAGDASAEISGDVKFHAATEFAEQLAELGEAAGIHQYSEEDIEAAFLLALDIYRSARQEEGRLPVDEISQDMQELVAAEQQGRIEDVLPGITEYAQRAQGRGAAPQGGPQGGESRGLIRNGG